MESPIKCFNIEAFGNHHRVFADQSVDARYVQETLNLGKVSVFQFSYTEYLIADNWLIYMESYLQKKGLFRFELKKIFKETQKSLRKTIKIVEENSEPDYCNEYANQLYDITIPILEKLRDQIAEKLQNLGVPRAGLCATVVVLQNLVCMSVSTFDHIFNRIQYLRHLDIKKCFMAIYPELAIKQVEEMLKLVMHEDRFVYQKNIVENKKIKQTFEKFTTTLYDPKNIKKASCAAYEAMSDAQKERYMLLSDGACVLKEYVNAKNEKDGSGAS